ncbi:hypothetical protein GIB67_005096 [Kingdonia uniflora]|uniref:DUF3511 domain protein n=1 Tax=Kingdonia uniflora TaxID=39325 RepID=A0A7J7PDP6_9MAGN|nr:hypothetical protein GIB67_005096 [Kingdonia uniflora]
MPRIRTQDPPQIQQTPQVSRPRKKKKTPSSSSLSASSSSSKFKSWSLNDPEMKRRKRVAKYKIYAVEGKVKSTFSRGLRWIKNKCSEIVHGF